LELKEENKALNLELDTLVNELESKEKRINYLTKRLEVIENQNKPALNKKAGILRS